MSQTSYSLNMAVGYEGQLADSRPADIFTAKNTDSVDIPFGRFVVKGTGNTGAKLPSSGSDTIIGVAVLSHARLPRGGNWVSGAPVTTSADTGVAVGDMMNVMARGVILCVAEETLVPGDAVYVRFDATGATGSQALGRVRNDADSSKAVLVSRARFLTGAAAGEVIQVDLNLP